MENDANPNPALIQSMDQKISIWDIASCFLRRFSMILCTMKTWEKYRQNVNLKDVVFSLANRASVSTLLINKSWKNLLPNLIDSENSIKISHSEARAALNTSLQWAEEQNFEAHGNYAPQTFKRPRI
ncbi:hypothetical protein AVEN_264476-1 [Araneus ventricosus]|uniref:DDE-1 domain-containing protein n=1 Tax=Araneus ventricosus TaxID=182803 RepID=A0A4Y2IKG3_ARAVE|nr:hypothetical protein AVEN_264476-1 [Araneus ventricosus]